jgi:ABC-type glycerol-3-phosphate transport system substrate-binding protein
MMVDLLLNGDVSMSMAEWLNHPDFISRGDAMKKGNLQYGHMFYEPHEEPSAVGYYHVSLGAKPEKVDKAKYERQQKAAIEFMNFYLNKNRQIDNINDFGQFPVRQDVFDQVKKLTPHEEKHHMAEVGFEMMKKSSYGWAQHPNYQSVAYSIMPPYVQKVLKGEMKPDKAMETAAEEARNLLKESGWRQ